MSVCRRDFVLFAFILSFRLCLDFLFMLISYPFLSFLLCHFVMGTQFCSLSKILPENCRFNYPNRQKPAMTKGRIVDGAVSGLVPANGTGYDFLRVDE
jgi:hypothetical protein